MTHFNNIYSTTIINLYLASTSSFPHISFCSVDLHFQTELCSGKMY